MKRLTVLFLFIPVALLAQKNYPAYLDLYMKAEAKVHEFTGTVLVSQKGKIIYKRAFGFADREWHTPNIIQSKFEIGSLTKQFTAVAILQLAEEGKINLDDKLSKYIPGFTRGDSITIAMLLNHTSGLRDFKSDPRFEILVESQLLDNDTRYLNDSLVNYFKKNPYDFPAGTQWKYSNTGYFLLGYIIEKITGQSYSDYILHNIIQKAGLKNTLINRFDSIVPYRAKGYARTQEGWKNARYLSMEVPYSAGNMMSTVEDLYQWNNALFSGKVISREMFQKMITPYLGNYGYGLFIDTFEHHSRIQHSGGINGFVSYIARFPTDDVVVVGLSNNENASTPRIVDALTAIMLDVPITIPYQHKESIIDSSILKRYVGKYQRQGISGLDTMMVKEGKLYWQLPSGRVVQMKPESATKFFIEEYPYIQFEFNVNTTGQVTKAYSIDAGVKNEIKRF